MHETVSTSEFQMKRLKLRISLTRRAAAHLLRHIENVMKDLLDVWHHLGHFNPIDVWSHRDEGYSQLSKLLHLYPVSVHTVWSSFPL